MNLRQRTSYAVALACAVLITLGTTARAQTESFRVTLTNLTGGQPFSPPVFVTHDATVSEWHLGDYASNDLRQIAEEGDNSSLLFNYGAQVGGSVGSLTAPLNSPLLPGATVSFFIQTDALHPFLSSAWMLGLTNDGFSGLDSLNLLAPGGTGTFLLDAYDAGTEVNNESADYVPGLGGHFEDPDHQVIMPHPGILGIGDIPRSAAFSAPVARLSISQVPEPTPIAMFAASALSLLFWVARRRVRGSSN